MESWKEGGRRTLAAVLLPALVLLVALVPTNDGVADESDLTVAKALLASAEAQFKKKNYDATLSLIEKTLAEAPTYLPALEFKATVLEKIGRRAEAADAYQAWLDAYEGHSAAGTLGKSDARKKKTIDKRLERLTQARRDLRAIEAGLKQQLSAFAEKWADQAPRAVERAKALIDVLAMDQDGSADAELPPDAMSRVYRKLAPSNEVDLIQRKSLGSPDGIAYPEEGGMRLTYTDGGTIVQPVETLAAGPAYVYEVRFALQPRGNRWLTGLVFGIEGPLHQFFAAFVKDGKLQLHRVSGMGKDKEDVAVQRVLLRPGKPASLTVVVDRLSISVYVNGKKEISYTAPRTHDLGGGVGLWVQDSVVDAAVLKLGRLSR